MIIKVPHDNCLVLPKVPFVTYIDISLTSCKPEEDASSSDKEDGLIICLFIVHRDGK